MAQYFFRNPAIEGNGEPVIAKNSEVFAKGDPLTKSSGYLKVAAAGEKIVGFCLEDYTASSSNQTVAKYCPQYVEPFGVEMVYTANQAVTQANLSQYADLTGTTGAIQISASTAGATGQFAIIGFDPNNDGTTTLAIVKVAEPQYLAFAQS